jgi:glycosyltransferase involved in cell wall biosynthesis
MDGLFFDCRYIRIDQHDGISRFSTGLFNELSKITPVTAIIYDLRQLEQLPQGASFLKVSAPTSILEPLVALQINKSGAKTVFSPMQTIGSLGRRFKLVLTVHDLIYYRHPEPPQGFSFAIRLLWRLYHLVYWPQRLLLNRANAVVTVSETTKDLIAKHSLTNRPVRVVANAPDSIGEFPAPANRPIVKQSLVYMGSFMDYKNVELLIRAMSGLSNYELHLLSKISPQRQAQLEKLIPLGSEVVFHNGVTDAEYQRILSSAVALVSASRDEGFGIPLVESMSRGIPVVVSEIEIFKEIGGQAAIYFDQEDVASFVSAVRSLEDEDEWTRRSAAAQGQAAKFTWKKSAESLLKLLKQI